MVWLPDGEKNFEYYMFIRFDMIHERDRRTPHDGYHHRFISHEAAQYNNTNEH